MLRTQPCRVFLSGAVLTCATLALSATPLFTQSAAAQAPAASRILGTVTALNDGIVTVHQEGASTGDIAVTITAQSRLLRTAPGEKDLKNATPMQATDLAIGDRVLIRPTPDSDPQHPNAGILIAMKQGDITQAHEQEAGDWQRHGVSGIVQSVDTSAGTITLKPQAEAPPLVIQVAAATVIRHYAPDSTAFADAHKVTLADIHPGDQLRARGTKDPAAPTIVATEVVAGSFQNIAGTVLSTDPAANTVSLTNLATKRPVTLYLEAGTQLRMLPPEMSARLARHSSAAAGAAGSTPGTPATATPASAEATGAPHTHSGGGGNGELAGALQRAPSITLADLKKGAAVMIVASGPGAPKATAITVIAGVEALLQASPEASAGLFSASWNLGGGGADTGGEGGAPR